MKSFSSYIQGLLVAILLTGTSLGYAQTTTETRTFKHPGINISMDQLDLVKQKVLAKEQPWYASWNFLISEDTAKPTYGGGGKGKTGIGGSDGTRQRASKDGMAAWYSMVQYYVLKESNPTVAEQHAQKAFKILREWAQDIDYTQAEGQLFMLPICTVVAAAEMCKLYDKYTEDSLAHFKDVCLNKWKPDLIAYQASNGWPGWDGPTNQALLYISIFLDDDSLYQECIDYYRYGMSANHPKVKTGEKKKGAGAGRIGYMVFDPDNGLSVEMGRDCPHSEIGLSSAAFFCHTAWIQGDDLFDFDDNILLKGIEGWAKYTLNQEVYWPKMCTRTDDRLTQASHKDPNRITGCMQPEIAVLHYAHRLGVDVPYSQGYVKMRGVTRNGWGGAYHPVLCFCDESMVKDYYQTSKPDAPQNLVATPGPGRVTLRWKVPDWSNINGTVIERKVKGETKWNVIYTYSMNTSKEYIDKDVTDSVTYYYRVASKNNVDNSKYSNIASATPASLALPEDWECITMGSDSLKAEAGYNPAMKNSFYFRATGNQWGKADGDAVSMLRKKISGDCVFVVHQRDWQNVGHGDRFGLCFRATKAANSRSFGVGCGDTDSRISNVVVRSAVGGSVEWQKANTHTHFTDYWYRIDKIGNTMRAYQSGDGKVWVQVGEDCQMTFPANYYVCIYACNNTAVSNPTGLYLTEVQINPEDVNNCVDTDTINTEGIIEDVIPTDERYGKLGSSLNTAKDATSLTTFKTTIANAPTKTKLSSECDWKVSGSWTPELKKFDSWPTSSNGENIGYAVPLLEMWYKNATTNVVLSQEINGLPDGYYTFSAQCGPWVKNCSKTTELTSGLYVFANDDKTPVSTKYTSGAATYSVTTLVTDGTLRVGMKQTTDDGATGANWYLFGSPKLTYSAPVYNLTTDSNGYATVCLPFDAELPLSLQAFTLSDNLQTVDESSASVTLIEKGYIPACTPMVVHAEQGTYTLQPNASLQPLSTELLSEGILAGTHFKRSVEKGNYFLQSDGESTVFNLSSQASTLKAFQAYIPNNNYQASTISLGDVDSTPVCSTLSDIDKDYRVYSLDGKRRTSLQRGLNIVVDRDGHVSKILKP